MTFAGIKADKKFFSSARNLSDAELDEKQKNRGKTRLECSMSPIWNNSSFA